MTHTTEGGSAQAGSRIALGDEKRPRLRARDITIFSAAFLAVEALVFFWLPYYGKGNVWQVDGLTQHFSTLYYFSAIVKRFIADPSVGLPLWSWRLGLGGDTMSTLNFYVLGDPFALVALLLPLKRIELAYEIMLFLRLYAAGLCSFLYFRRLGARSPGAFAGSLVYVFTAWTLFASMRHPFFANALVFLPLMLLGLEKVFRRERPYLLVASVFLAAVNSFYFFWMLTLTFVVYALVRYLDLAPAEQRWRRLLSEAVRVAGLYLLGTALAAFMLVPVLMGILGSSRVGPHSVVPAFYRLSEYGGMLVALFFEETAPRSTYLGYSVIALVLVPVLLFQRRGDRTMRWMVVLVALFAAIPAVGLVYSGFAATGNRWIFAAGLFLGGAVAMVLSRPEPLSARDLIVSLVFVAGYSLLVALAQPRKQILVVLLLATLMIVFLALERMGKAPADGWALSGARWVVIALAVVNLALNGMFRYDLRFSKMLTEWEAFGTPLRMYQEDPGSLARRLPGAASVRIDKQDHVVGHANDVVSSNDALIQDYNGTDIYLSVVDSRVSAFMQEMQNRTSKLTFAYAGFDDRAALMSLMGVKYYLVRDDLTELVPYGFERMGRLGSAWVYRNRNALPLGFVYDRVVPRADYLAMAPLERQAALLAGAVVGPQDAAGLPVARPPLRVAEVLYTLPQARTRKGKLVLARNGSGWVAYDKLTLRFPPVRDAELYAELRGLDVTPPPKKPVAEKTIAAGHGLLGRFEAWKQRQLSQNILARVYTLMSAGGGAEKSERWDLPVSPYYAKDRDELFNLGYRRKPTDVVTVRMQSRGNLHYRSLRLYAVDPRTIGGDVARLRQRALRNVRISNNRFSGRVGVGRAGILFLSIPYSSGWRATVDGRPAELLRVNTAFSGVRMDGAAHRIELRYRPPGLLAGAAISGIALAALLGVVVLTERQRRQRSREVPSGA